MAGFFSGEDGALELLDMGGPPSGHTSEVTTAVKSLLWFAFSPEAVAFKGSWTA